MSDTPFVPELQRAPDDIYTETEPNWDVLSALGPLAPMAGSWYGPNGVDINPKLDGPQTNAYQEYYKLEVMDPQNNGPQVLYPLRYHTHIVEPGNKSTFHDQVGYWLWDPQAELVYLCACIPRAQCWMAIGPAKADSRVFTLWSVRDTHMNTIASGPFLEEAFQTTQYKITVTINDDGTWAYDQVTTLIIPGYDKPFEHRDTNVLHMTKPPCPNPGQIDEGFWPLKPGGKRPNEEPKDESKED